MTSSRPDRAERGGGLPASGMLGVVGSTGEAGSDGGRSGGVGGFGLVAAADGGRPSAIATRLGWLRAGVLGANDGIVSTAGLVVGVAAATATRSTIATAGIAGLVAGAVSMALGEYVSVSSQRDAESAMVAAEVARHRRTPDDEHHELVHMLRARGLSDETSRRAADELTAHDALATHLELELGLDREALADPWAAAASSALAFTLGALLPLVAVLLPPASVRVPVTVVAVLVALAGTGALSARLGGASIRRAVTRLVLGGALALAVTYAIGAALGTHVG